jgi:hypothetical protein
MRTRNWIKVGLIVMGLLAVLSLGASLLLTSTTGGRRWVADKIEQIVSDNVPGSLKIGELVDLGPPLVAKDVRFFHPDGRVVLHCKDAEIVLDIMQALRGRLAFERAAVDGGRILLAMEKDGRVALEAALSEPSKPGGPPSDPHGGLHYALQSMHVQNFELQFKAAGAPSYTLHGVEGFVGVRRIESSGTYVTLEKVSAKRVEPGLLGAKTALKQVDGWVHGKEKHVLHLDAATVIGSGSLDARVDMYDRKKTPIEVVIKQSQGTAGDMVSSLLDLGSSLFGEDALKVEVKD